MKGSYVIKGIAGVLALMVVLLTIGCGPATRKIVRGDGDPMDPAAEFWVEKVPAEDAGSGTAWSRSPQGAGDVSSGGQAVAKAPAANPMEPPVE